jgi:hypothetical protein
LHTDSSGIGLKSPGSQLQLLAASGTERSVFQFHPDRFEETRDLLQAIEGRAMLDSKCCR